MKLLRLEILNLASLDKAGGEIIDFESGAIGASKIFSIVGPTGSGKSTILDAICLALFNRAPRYPKKKNDRNQAIEIYGRKDDEENCRLAPSDSRNILTRGKKFGYSRLTFLADNDNIYRAEWSVAFKRTRYDNAVTALYKILPDGTAIECDWNELPRIIGLDYDQFLRTVLIAQGSFAGFINAREDERYELLEKLIGSEGLYSRISSEISECRRKAAETFNSINAGISVYANDDLSPEQAEQLSNEISLLEKEQKEVIDKIESLKKQIEWYTAEDQLVGELSNGENILAKAKEMFESLKELRSRLSFHDASIEAVAYYRDITTGQENTSKLRVAIEKFSCTIDKLCKDIATANSELETLKVKTAKAHENYELQKPHINRAREIKVEIEQLKSNLNEKKQTLRDASTALEKADKEIADNKNDIANAAIILADSKKALETTKENISNNRLTLENDLAVTKKAYDELVASLNRINPTELQNSKNKADNDLADIRDLIRIRTSVSKLRDRLKSQSEDKAKLEKRNKEIATELDSLSIAALTDEFASLTRIHILMTGQDFGQQRHMLTDGQPCPLCGATHHPYADESELTTAVSDIQILIDRKQKDLNEQTQRNNALSREHATNSGTLKELDKAISNLSEEIESLEFDIAQLTARHSDWNIDTEDLTKLHSELTSQATKAAEALGEYNELSSKTDKQRRLLEDCAKALDAFMTKAESELKNAEKKLLDAEFALKTHESKTAGLENNRKEKSEAVIAARTAVESIETDICKKAKELSEETDNKDPEALDKELSAAKDSALKAEQEKVASIAQLNSTLQGERGRLDVARQNLSSFESVIAQSKEKLERWLESYNRSNDVKLSAADIATIGTSSENWEDIRKHIKECSDQVTAATATLANIRLRHKAHQGTKPEVSLTELQELKRGLETKDFSALDTARLRMQAYIRAKEKMGELYDKRLEARQNLDEWDEITQAIGGEGKTLRKIAQCYTLRFLIYHANSEIRRFNSRYELVQVPNSLGIRVIDHDRADDIRDTTSLSGGETFIVSLGLALGLSALSSRNISLDNLFIDEGFGTLDPDTLATVIDSLATLQSSRGKKVGVISHTDVMSERITTQIRIIKNGNSGSSHIEIHSA